MASLVTFSRTPASAIRKNEQERKEGTDQIGFTSGKN
jgi:hypothetical protein